MDQGAITVDVGRLLLLNVVHVSPIYTNGALIKSCGVRLFDKVMQIAYFHGFSTVSVVYCHASVDSIDVHK